MCRIVGLLGLLFLTSTLALAQGVAPVVLEAHCDAGDDLNSVLREAEVLARGGFACGPPFGRSGRACVTLEARPVLIKVSGTCNGPVSIKASDITLRGVGDAVIQHSPGHSGETLPCYAVPCVATVYVDGATGVNLDNLTIRGPDEDPVGARSVELYARMSAVKIQDCEFAEGQIGLWAESSLLEASDSTVDIDGSEGTVVGNAASHLRLSNTELLKGVTLIDSEGVMRGGRIETSSVHVIDLYKNSRFEVDGSELVGSFVRAQDHSHIRLHPSSTSIEGVTLQRDSSVDIGVNVNGFVSLYDHCHGSLGGEIDGAVSLYTFSSLRVTGDITGSLSCSEVSDAVCSGISGVSTCDNCPGTTTSAIESSDGPHPKATASMSSVVEFINGARPGSTNNDHD